ncbi:UNVERIFIED_CONTAM: hypothetical protein Sindi_2431100 [Sesamum indicum]
MFQKMLEDHQPQPTTDDLDAPAESEASMEMTEQYMLLVAVGGKNKGRVFGLVFEAYISNCIFTSPSLLTPQPPNPAMEDHIGCLETMIDMMREMRASSSTVALTPTNPRTENQDADEEHLD